MSPELRAAYNLLDDAIVAVRKAACPDITSVLGDWAIIAAEHEFTEGKDYNVTTYSRMFRGGQVSYHVAIGLFQTAMELTSQGEGDED